MPGVGIKMLMGSNLSTARRGRRKAFPCPGALVLGFKCHFQRGAVTMEMPDGLQAGERARGSRCSLDLTDLRGFFFVSKFLLLGWLVK